MKTPKEYTSKLKEGIITKDMLRDCLFSVNKRAKNCRDREREYRQLRHDWYGNTEKYQNKKEEYYKQKEVLLSVLKPVCIHKELLGYERRRIYDYESDYCQYMDEYVWENCYWDPQRDREVWFGDIELKDEPVYHYYLFYELGERSFHTPISEVEVDNYKDLQVVTIDQLITYGNEIVELASTQFVNKVITLIQSKNYTYEEAV